MKVISLPLQLINVLNVLVVKNDKFQVSFDGHQEIRIKVDVERFKEKTEGICGFLDNR